MATTSEIEVRLTGGVAVEAAVGGFVIRTDQPPSVPGGTGSAPSPFDLFLASVATCAGFFIARFCLARGIDTSQVRLVQRVEHDPDTRAIRAIRLEVKLPRDFPEKYVEAVVRAADQCTVKRTIAAQPEIHVEATREERPQPAFESAGAASP